MSARLTAKLAALKSQKRAGFVPFIMAGDPTLQHTAALLGELPSHGADMIELGMPFSDPMADGPTIQSAAIRSLASHTKLDQILSLVESFRTTNQDTPVILMGYYNPVFHYGVARFMQRAAACGVDALIIVDLPAEELNEALPHARGNAIDLISLIAPTSLATRLDLLAQQASGFVYYIAVKGITGDKSADYQTLGADVSKIRQHIPLPVAVGFGIKTPEDVAQVSACADLVVVGSRIVSECESAPESVVKRVLSCCQSLAGGIQPHGK